MTGSLAGAIEFIRLEETLRAFADGERLLFVVNRGNWGDGLIRYATERFFRRMGLDYTSISLRDARSMGPDDLRATTGSSRVRLVFSGGGAFLESYDIPRQFRRLVKKTDQVLVLPHTFAMPVEELRLRKTDILFRRDQSGSTRFAPEAVFCHDMALSLDCISPLVDGCGVGFFMRGDIEKVGGITVPEGNRDISAEGTETTPMADFLEAIGRFEIVHTNRLHVAIAAALMGRQVHLYANSYFKNRAIYDASLRSAFPNVTFHDDYAAFPTQSEGARTT